MDEFLSFKARLGTDVKLSQKDIQERVMDKCLQIYHWKFSGALPIPDNLTSNLLSFTPWF